MICKIDTVLGRDRVGGYAARIGNKLLTGGAVHTSHDALAAMARDRVRAEYGEHVEFVVSGSPRSVARSGGFA